MDPVTLQDVPLWNDYAVSLNLLDDDQRKWLYEEAMKTESTWKDKTKKKEFSPYGLFYFCFSVLFGPFLTILTLFRRRTRR